MKNDARKALIVEDEESWLDLLGLLLSEAGYEAVRAGNVAEALSLARNERFDLAVVDIGLPDESGMTLLRDLRRLPGHEDVPIIVLSAYHREEVADLDFGDAQFVSKDQGLPPLLASLKSIS